LHSSQKPCQQENDPETIDTSLRRRRLLQQLPGAESWREQRAGSNLSCGNCWAMELLLLLQIEALKSAGVDEVILAINYQPEVQ
jgi:hypothetical protein